MPKGFAQTGIELGKHVFSKLNKVERALLIGAVVIPSGVVLDNIVGSQLQHIHRNRPRKIEAEEVEPEFPDDSGTSPFVPWHDSELNAELVDERA